MAPTATRRPHRAPISFGTWPPLYSCLRAFACTGHFMWMESSNKKFGDWLLSLFRAHLCRSCICNSLFFLAK